MIYQRTSNLLVEGNGVTKERVDHVGVVVKLLVHHKGKDAHHGGTAVVELDGRHTLEVEGTDGRGREVGRVLAASLLNLSLKIAKIPIKSIRKTNGESSS